MDEKIGTKDLVGITKGQWQAQWAHWTIQLRLRSEGWRVDVFKREDADSKFHLGMRDVKSPLEGAQWACGVLAKEGVKVLIDGQTRPLADFLAWSPMGTSS